ncbi:MAG: 3-deoxy-manno-octulosonate cytidylyltransferase [Elusimicrobia bacterium]|nr:3-deoxy-manno-octulosonate cytidylyltransferase [Elusimicrobiota bacterium]
MTKGLIVIPARYGSTRLLGKPLVELGGKPLIQWVYERCRQVQGMRVVVATDDKRIAEAVQSFGGEPIMTSAQCVSGTDRVAEVARRMMVPIIINVQGDEPCIHPVTIQAVWRAIQADPSVKMATAATPCFQPSELADPHTVKVVTDRQGNALYFSRSPIPAPLTWPSATLSHQGRGRRMRLPLTPANGQFPLKHVGIYVYRRSFLLHLAQWKPTLLEQHERLEQLRALEHGYRIKVVVTPYDSLSVDTPADLDRVRRSLGA